MEDVKKNLPSVDGFDTAEDGTEGQGPTRIIQGERLSFSNDFVWLLGGDAPFPKDRELVPVNIIRVVQKWVDKMPTDNIIVEPGQKWPDVEALNEACPQSEWAKDFNGVLKGPWQRQRVVYFVDLATMQKYTWSVPVETVGADICIREFRDKVAMMRQFRGERVFAVVTLGDTFMPTRFGGRQRPALEVQRWILLGPSGTALPAPSTPSLPPAQSAAPVDPQSGIETVEPPSLSEQMQDEVPTFDDPLPESMGGSPMPAPTTAPPTRKPAAPSINKRGVTKIARAR